MARPGRGHPGGRTGTMLGSPDLDSRGGSLLPAEVVSHSHLRSTRLLASAGALMDKTSCQCLSPRLHPEVGASSRGAALGTRGWGWGGSTEPRSKAGLSRPGSQGRSSWRKGGPQSSSAAAGLGVRTLGPNPHSHKGSDYCHLGPSASPPRRAQTLAHGRHSVTVRGECPPGLTHTWRSRASGLCRLGSGALQGPVPSARAGSFSSLMSRLPRSLLRAPAA